MSPAASKINVLFQEIQQGEKAAFNELFNRYYTKLVAFAKQYLQQQHPAEEIVSELFVKIWLRHQSLSNVLNPEVYLYVSVRNACLNFIRSNKQQAVTLSTSEETTAGAYSKLEDKELASLIDRAVASLPEQRRIIFKLIKEDGLKAQTAAQILGISKRTVENQLYKALKSLADAISSYLGYHPQSRLVKRQIPSALYSIFF